MGYAKNEELESALDSIILHYIKQFTKNEDTTLKELISFFEKKVIYTVLDLTNGNQKDASEILGLRTTTLHEKLKRYGFRRNDFKFKVLELVEYKLRSSEKNIHKKQNVHIFE